MPTVIIEVYGLYEQSTRCEAIKGGFRRPPRPEEGPPINERCLRYRDLRVIGPDGEQIGIIQSRQALTMAREQGLDLVVVSPTAQPPVCKIIDYGKHKYQLEKLQKESKKKTQDVKGIKISPRIAEHDMMTFVGRARSFLEEGDKVRVVCQFKAREVTHPEIGHRKMTMFSEALADVSIVESPPRLDGKLMTMVLLPKPGRKEIKKNAQDQNQQDGSKKVQDHRDGEDHPSEGVQQPHVLQQEQRSEETPGE